MNILRDIRTAYSDWASVLGTVGAAVALASFLSHVFTVPLSEIVKSFLEAYRAFFHAPFRLVEYLFSIKTPVWLSDLFVFWFITGGIGARVYLRLSKTYLSACMNRRDKAIALLKDPQRTATVEKNLGHGRTLASELEFLRTQIVFTQQTITRRRLLILGCLVTGPLFMAGLAWFNPPAMDQIGGARRFLMIEVLAILAAIIVMFVLDWSLVSF